MGIEFVVMQNKDTFSEFQVLKSVKVLYCYITISDCLLNILRKFSKCLQGFAGNLQ